MTYHYAPSFTFPSPEDGDCKLKADSACTGHISYTLSGS